MIVDAHLDIAWNALAEGRGFSDPRPDGYIVDRASLVEAGVGLVFATIFTAPSRAPGMSAVPYAYRTSREAYLLGRTQLAFYRSVGLTLIRTREQLQRYCRDWKRGDLAAVVLMENADPVETPAQLGEWHDRGVRLIGPAWSRTRYCGGTHAPGGLTDAGRGLLRSMRRRGVALDLSHMADRSVRDSLEVWTGPLMASHVGARSLCARQRLLPDDVIRAVGDAEGVMGVSLYGGHLAYDGVASIEDVVNHAGHFAEIAGDPAFVGLGSDLDGGFNSGAAAIRSLGELRELEGALRRRFGREATEGIMGLNWVRFLEGVLPSEATAAA